MKQLQIALTVPWHVHTGMFVAEIQKTFGDAVRFKWVYDDDAERGKAWADKLGARYTANYGDVTGDPDVDMVMIEAQTCRHKELIIEAAKAGKHVYTDKILAITTADALEIKQAVEQAGVKFCVSHESLPNGPYVYAKRLVEEGKLGKVVSVYFRRAHGLAKNPSVSLAPGWFDPAVSGGGALIDLGVHCLSMLPWIAGEPKSVSCLTANFTGMQSEDSATILVDFVSGAQGSAHTDMVTNIMENYFEIVGTDGMLLVVGWRGQETVFLNSAHIPGCEKTMVQRPLSEVDRDQPVPVCQFVRLILDGAKENSIPGFDLEMGLTVTRLAEAAYESAACGKAVAFDKRW